MNDNAQSRSSGMMIFLRRFHGGGNSSRSRIPHSLPASKQSLPILTPNMPIQEIVPMRSSLPPRLAHGLDRVLFNPGVFVLKDLRTNVYNFDPYLENIIDMKDFNFDCLPPFVSASEDKNLHQLAALHKLKYISSTSSMSPSLSQLYYVVSGMKDPDTSHLSQAFSRESKNYTAITRAPVSIILTPVHGIYSITAEKLDDKETILSKMGQVLERLLTTDKANFERMKIGSPNPLVFDNEAFYYCKAGSILLRSQLDCYDPRLPRKTFDLKTRATLPVRMDHENWSDYSSYILKRQYGLFESFEREMYDLTRAALLKYNFQVRIGNMDGIFIAYHNVSRLFGFQYLSREEMDEIIYGNTWTADATYNLLLQLYNHILDSILSHYKIEQTLKLTFSASRDGSFLNIFVESSKNQLKQFVLTCTSYINDIKSYNVEMKEERDRWRLQYQLLETQADRGTYDTIR